MNIRIFSIVIIRKFFNSKGFYGRGGGGGGGSGFIGWRSL
jgi:hypothetical protein